MTPDPRASDIHNTLIELLADGLWHDYYVVLAQAAKTVQPGRAIRQCETDRQVRMRRRVGEPAPERTKPLSTADQIRTGSRSIVRKRMLNKVFEIDPPGPQPAGTRKRIRLRPRVSQEIVLARDPRRSPHTQAALELLVDGAWHPLEDALTAGMKMVPEEQAYRKATRGGTKGSHSREQSIRTGAHALVYDALHRNNLVEIDRTGSTPRIRLRP